MNESTYRIVHGRAATRLVVLIALLTLVGCAQSPAASNETDPSNSTDETETTDMAEGELKTAVLAGGCFWCTEAVFEPLDGVHDVVSGYAGGSADTADYRKVAAGRTDHAEAIQITYDPAKISYEKLLEIFFTIAHDPTQLNRQGPDTGKQYRSAVFYADDEEKQIAENYIRQLEQRGVYDDPIVTTLEPLDQFYVAEDYHQDYARLNPSQPYIRFNAQPKVEKLKNKYGEMVSE